MHGLLPASLPMMKVMANITALLLTKFLPRIEILLRKKSSGGQKSSRGQDLPGDRDPPEYSDITEERCPREDRGSSEDRDPTEARGPTPVTDPTKDGSFLSLSLRCKYNMFDM